MSSASSSTIPQIRQDRRSVEGDMRRHYPVYAEQVRQMQRIYCGGGALNQIQRILIACGMSLLSGEESSIEWCISRALNHGGTVPMLREVIDVALLNGGTFVVPKARFAHEYLSAVESGALKADPS